MAGMNDTTPNRRNRRAAAATGAAPVEPAIDASVERAAIERAPGDTVAPVAGDISILSAAAVPDDAVVLPEPTLVAEPDAPMPIVTASPILATEPSAIDVVQADGAADRVAAGIDPAPGPDAPHLAAAGQPTLTLEGATAASVAHTMAAGALGGMSNLGRDILAPEGGWIGSHDDVPSLDQIVRGLERMLTTDPIGLDIIWTRFFDDLDRAQLDRPSGFVGNHAVAATVTVIEVVGPAQGRRRAGMVFGAQPRRLLASTLTEDQIAALRADPLLAVGISEMDEDAAHDALLA